MVADKFTDLQKAVGKEITKTDLVPAFQVRYKIPGFFWTFRKNSRPKKTQAGKKTQANFRKNQANYSKTQ